jgi:uncharacterized protein YkwD
MMAAMRSLISLLSVALALTCTLLAAPAFAVGEPQNGFPTWAERMVHEWMNRARVDPQVEMAACGSACGDAACYAPVPPLAWDVRLNRSARFHSDEMVQQNYFGHPSSCTVVSNIDAIYPASCQGAASCACEGGTSTCGASGCTQPQDRVSLFGASFSGEIIAGGGDPNDAFYLWLYEPIPKTTSCGYIQGNGQPGTTNGHRYNILESMGGVGVGVSLGGQYGGDYTGDFDFNGPAPAQIPSGSHYPRQAATVDAWANWYDTTGPKSALVDVDGACTPMKLERGSAMNGAYHAALSGVGSGCHRYYFVFADGAGQPVTFPTTGSLGIGPEDGTCADWDSSRPAEGAGCSCTPSCAEKSCGDDGCGGSCGVCPGSDGGLSGSGDQGGDGGTGGTTGGGCDVGGPSLPAGALLFGLALFALALRRRAG